MYRSGVVRNRGRIKSDPVKGGNDPAEHQYPPPSGIQAAPEGEHFEAAVRGVFHAGVTVNAPAPDGIQERTVAPKASPSSLGSMRIHDRWWQNNESDLELVHAKTRGDFDRGAIRAEEDPRQAAVPLEKLDEGACEVPVLGTGAKTALTAW